MTGTGHRLESGGLIDRDRRVTFRFNGEPYQGFRGDTLASALLANGVHLVGRSFKYHRPRGIVSAGAEEPNALVQVGRGPARTDPNIRATQLEIHPDLVAESQNCWPSVERDAGAINDLIKPLIPAGFYYKTFMWPKAGWHVYERFIRRAAGLGRSPTAPDPDRYEHMHAHADVVVVGGGPAGLAAALEAGRTGARVILADERAAPGGSLLWAAPARTSIDGRAPAGWAAAALAELATMPEVRVLPRTTVFGYYNDNYLCALERVADHLPPDAWPQATPRQRLWKIRARRVVLATGAIERPLVFPGNDRPGIMLAGAVSTYVNQYAVLPGISAAVVTSCDSAYATALDLADAGAEVQAIIDLRADPSGALVAEARQRGLRIIPGSAVTATRGRLRVSRIAVSRLGEGADRGEWLDCDLLAMSGGWTPSVHLFSQSRGRLAYSETIGAFVPAEPFQDERSAGSAAGIMTLSGCLESGARAGLDAARNAGHPGPSAPRTLAATAADASAVQPIWKVPTPNARDRGRSFVDQQNDVTVKDLGLAIGEGYESIEHVKRYTTTGMGTDQGKTGNVNALGIVADLRGMAMADIGVTTFRPPYTPVTFGAIAGHNRGPLFAPTRTTPMHGWHEEHGAVFEPVGDWLRPWYYPRRGETMEQAVSREAMAARTAVAMLDATTLGKIDVQGRDAAEFLNRVYTNAWSKLAVGRCRYGVMLGEDGMVMDDGVTARLGDNHFHMTTTTGGAPRVMAWLENWLQTEWPHLDVYLTSVTEQWAVVSLCGPGARALVSEIVDDIDLSPETFRFMDWREGHVMGGVPARIFRISFTGESSFEINVPASFGLDLWTTLWERGHKHGLTPYGTETMHLLRAEKGFIIVGQETDGTVTPPDLDMDWIISKKKPDFIGKRSLTRTDTVREDRKQLVGLKTDDPAIVLEEGAHIIVDQTPGPPPVPMLGHVTSSYWSPTLGRSIALALVKGGSQRRGERLFVAMPDRTIPVTVCETVFVDPEGERLHA